MSNNRYQGLVLVGMLLAAPFTACGESDPLDPTPPQDPTPDPTGAIRVHILIDGSGTDRDGLLVNVDGESSVVISPDQAHLYVPLPDFDMVEIVSTSQNAVVGMIPVAGGPVDVAFFESRAIVDSVSVQRSPGGIALGGF